MQVSWSDKDTFALLDLTDSHKAITGDGLNFKAPLWNTCAASLMLANHEKGEPQTPKACKEKWKRVHDTYVVVDHLRCSSGFAYSLESGADIGVANKNSWDSYVKAYKDAAPYKNKGWLFYDRMSVLIPSKCKGLNCFLALSINNSA
ncbi:hypothetical protein M404DRAFT_155218 [Pisolithus tinctorius Marx 270]|uniref:Myb-like domain-containing protein n=1 Tax=Pisolithus tinctorius Marx 270 TaxID=870435 RepID=A0A0C3IR50_PISTI|nr:hypothetical protein M404DRAFT_155218 [Pisolithus tinctorius Marx 270]